MYKAPKGIPLVTGTNEVLKATQKVISSTQKYNRWSDNDVVNHRTFPVQAEQTPLRSDLKSIHNATIQTAVDGFPVSSPTSIAFKDPWLIDSSDSKGSLNRGTNAVYRSIGTPYTANNPIYNGVFLNLNPAQTPNYFSLRAKNTSSDLGGFTGYFQNWSYTPSQIDMPYLSSDSIFATNAIVFKQSGATVTANYKGTHVTGVSNSLSNTSQRKVTRTEDGYLFLTYESMNRVWLERSADGGTTWTLCNNGQPIDNGPEAKDPSIDYLTGLTSYNDPNEIFVTYQQKTSNGNYTIQLAQFNNVGQKQSDVTIFTSPSSYTNNATPVVGVTWYNRSGWRKQIVGIWKEPAASGINAGLYWYGAYYIGSTFYWNNPTFHQEIVSYSDASSSNPTIDVFKYDPEARIDVLYYHFAWEQTYPSYRAIKYFKVICGYSGLSLTGLSTPSTGNGFVYNFRPSLTTISNTGARMCWHARFDSPYDIDEFSRTIFTDPANGGVFWNYGGYVTSSNISKIYDDVYFTIGYSIGWTQLNGSSYSNYAVKNTALSTTVNLNSTGKDMQMHNSWDFTEQHGITLSTASPYSFLTTSPVQPPSGGGKELDKKGSVPILTGRMGVVTINDAQFHFMMGDILVNGQPIGFKQMYDTTTINSQEDIQLFLISDAFSLTNGVEFMYGVQFGVTDTVSARETLCEGSNVRFIVELIDATTGTVICAFDDVTYSESYIIPYSKIGYEVNTDGIVSRDVRLRLSATTNLPAQYSLSDVQSDYLTLAKNGTEYTKRNINGSSVVSEYSLDQNYPNPFNPVTTISYALPQDGLVILKIYDALGREVSTLVNEFKQTGRYTASLDASRLSSGVYIYTLTSGKYSATKKMVLVK